MAKNWAQKQYRFLNGAYDNKLLKKLAQYENDRQWQDVFNRLVSKAINQYEWVGDVPDTIDPYFFEEQLLFRGYACWIKISDKIYWSLPCVPTGTQNVYYEHNFYRAVSLGYTKEFKAITKYNKDVFDMISQIDSSMNAEYEGCVCLDNYMRYPMIETIRMYTDKIVDAMRTIDVCAKQLKLSTIIETDEDSKVAMQTAISQIDQNILAVYASSPIASKLRDSKAIPINNVAQTLTTAWNHLTNLWSEFNTAFGINNMNRTEKKERLLVDEVNANNEEIDANDYYRLDQRMRFCENLEAAFGIHVECRIKHAEDMLEDKEGEQGDGRLHDDAEGDNRTPNNAADKSNNSNI